MSPRSRSHSAFASLVLAVVLATSANLWASLAAAAPEIVNGRNFNGQFDPDRFPAVTGAVGTTRYIQVINSKFAIYSRATTSTTPVGTGTLNELAGYFVNPNSYSPQIIWDPTTSRFYYAMTSIFSANDQRLSHGWSKTASPNSAADFCHWSLGSGTNLMDAPKLGDSQHFYVLGANFFISGAFADAAVMAVPKPPAGSACGNPPIHIAFIRDGANGKVLSPVAADGIDTWSFGYVVARNFALPSDKLWLYSVTRNATTGDPAFGVPKQLALPLSYDAPPTATQPGVADRILTGDASPTQAVIARNPDRGNAFSLWTQHTVKNGDVSAIRWYEIDPFPNPPALRRNGLISAAGTFLFNAAISPDRRVDGATSAFGDSFVVQFNRSSAANNIFPQIRMGSSFNGGPLTFATVVSGVGPYRDATCTIAPGTCFWSGIAGAAPDPRPFTTGRGVVWGTNQFSGTANTTTTQANWRTRIFAVQP